MPHPQTTGSELSAPYVQWGPAIAGALAAAALAFVLHTFAAAIGLAVSSTSPTWRDTSSALLLLSGLYLILVAIVSFGVGGYLAGRLRTRLDGTLDEIEFRDGSHGLLVWAIAIVLTAFMVWAAAQAVSRATTTTGETPAAGSLSTAEKLIAYDLDRLFRGDRRNPAPETIYIRSEAARILLTASGHAGLAADDRTYLIRLTANTTGLPQAEAEKRVDAAIAQVQSSIRSARRSAIIISFMAGVAALLGAAVAWFAACAGGEHRDGRSAVPMYLRSRRTAESPAKLVKSHSTA